jgi:hypothetical protein
MRSSEESRIAFDNLRDIATNYFNNIMNLPLFGVNWEEHFAKVINMLYI